MLTRIVLAVAMVTEKGRMQRTRKACRRRRRQSSMACQVGVWSNLIGWLVHPVIMGTYHISQYHVLEQSRSTTTTREIVPLFAYRIYALTDVA